MSIDVIGVTTVRGCLKSGRTLTVSRREMVIRNADWGQDGLSCKSTDVF